MRFAIAPGVMNASDPYLDKLDELLARIEDEVHELEIIDADLLQESAWYKSSRQTRRIMLEKAAQISVYTAPRSAGPHLRRIQVDDENGVRVARDLAYTPLHVLVESFSSDGALLKFAIGLLSTSEVQELCLPAVKAITPPAFRIESPGGHGDLPKLLDQRLTEAARLGIPPRVVVVTDSDAEWPGEVKSHAEELREKCAAAGVPCPPLNKRTAENYVPDFVWKAWANDQPAARAGVEALLRLSNDQRDHVRIERTNIPPWDSSKPEVAKLFADVSPEDQAALTAASLKGRKTRAISYILETYGGHCDASELLARDHRRDLEAIVRHIKDEL